LSGDEKRMRWYIDDGVGEGMVFIMVRIFVVVTTLSRISEIN